MDRGVEELLIHEVDPVSADAQRLTELVHEMSEWYKGLNESGIKYFQEHSDGGKTYIIREGNTIMAASCYEVTHTQGEGNPVVMKSVEYPVAFVHGTVTAREAQGKGYGTTVLRAVLQGIKDAGIKHVQLTCNPERKGAIHLYKKMGFKEIGNKHKVTDVTKITTLFELDLGQGVVGEPQ